MVNLTLEDFTNFRVSFIKAYCGLNWAGLGRSQGHRAKIGSWGPPLQSWERSSYCAIETPPPGSVHDQRNPNYRFSQNVLLQGSNQKDEAALQQRISDKGFYSREKCSDRHAQKVPPFGIIQASKDKIVEGIAELISTWVCLCYAQTYPPLRLQIPFTWTAHHKEKDRPIKLLSH